MRKALIAICLALALPLVLPAQAKSSPDPALTAVVASPARSPQFSARGHPLKLFEGDRPLLHVALLVIPILRHSVPPNSFQCENAMLAMIIKSAIVKRLPMMSPKIARPFPCDSGCLFRSRSATMLTTSAIGASNGISANNPQ